MRLSIETSGSFNNITKWLNELPNKDPSSTLNSIGKEGVSALSQATPIGETGETAMGWRHKVSKVQGGREVAFVNNAHPEAQVNVAKIIQLGHGTGTGGYVPPYDYINPALQGVFKSAGDRLAKEMFK